MNQRHIIPIILILGSFVMLNATQTINAANGFVKRSGTHFTLNGAPLYVSGTNNHYIAWASQHEVDNMLTDAAAMHFNVVRTFISVVRGSLDGTTKPTIWNWNTLGDPSNMGMEGTYHLYWDSKQGKPAYNDSASGLQKIDYLINKANSLNLKVLISLTDFWHYTGGIQQMRAWYGSTDKYTFFYSDARTKQDYKNWVSHVLNHVNTFSGIAYKDDPAIFGWDLMNEPEVSSVKLAQSWIAEMSTFVKSIDHNHMVASGTEGFYGGQGGSEPDTELALPNIDFGTWHSYPVYHNISPAQFIDRINQHCASAARAQKPVLLEEFGYSSAHPDQAQVYQSWVQAVRNNPNCAGWMVWRLTSIQANNAYPRDNGEGFDFHNDNSQTSTVLRNEALLMQRLQPFPTPSFTATRAPASATPISTTIASPVPNTLQTLDANSSAVQKKGTWTVQNANTGLLGHYLYSSGSPSDTLTVNFQGTSISIIYVKHPSLGTFTVMVDGVTFTTDNSSASKSVFGSSIDIRKLADGNHTVKIQPVSGTIGIEAFIVEPQPKTVAAAANVAINSVVNTAAPTTVSQQPATANLQPTATNLPPTAISTQLPAATLPPTVPPTALPTVLPTMLPNTPQPTVPAQPQTLDANDPSVQKQGNWVVKSADTGLLGHYIASSGNPNDTLTVTFQGTSISTVYVKDPSGGIFTVTLDGVTFTTDNSSASKSVFGSRIDIRKLLPGQHILSIQTVSGIIGIEAFIVEP